MITDGTLLPRVIRSDHLKDPQRVGEPLCTHSQMIRYVDQAGQWVVEIHQYLRHDNTIGASGRPDPKRLRIGGIVYAIPAQG